MNTISGTDPIIDLGADPLPAPLEYRVRWRFGGDDLVVDVIRPRRYWFDKRLSTAWVGTPSPLPGEYAADRANRAVLDACRRAWAHVHLVGERLTALDDPARFTGGYRW